MLTDCNTMDLREAFDDNLIGKHSDNDPDIIKFERQKPYMYMKQNWLYDTKKKDVFKSNDATNEKARRKLYRETGKTTGKNIERGRVKKQHYILSLIHISEPTRPRLISYAVFCLKKKI